jgi:hypothetical protein
MAARVRESGERWAKRATDAFHGRPRAHIDGILLFLSALVVFALSAAFDLFNKIIAWIYRNDTWQLDEVFTVAVYLVLAMSFYAVRRNRELVAQIRLREKAEQENERLIPELENARADIARLRVLLPMCPSCKKVRRQSGHWEELETYVQIQLNTKVERGLCPDCSREMINRQADHIHG